MKPITAKINVTRILKEHLYQGKNGKYLDLVIWQNKDGPDRFGNTHSVQQDIGKAARDDGKQNPFIGNARVPEPEAERPAPKPAAPPPADDDFPVPF